MSEDRRSYEVQYRLRPDLPDFDSEQNDEIDKCEIIAGALVLWQGGIVVAAYAPGVWLEVVDVEYRDADD